MDFVKNITEISFDKCNLILSDDRELVEYKKIQSKKLEWMNCEGGEYMTVTIEILNCFKNKIVIWFNNNLICGDKKIDYFKTLKVSDNDIIQLIEIQKKYDLLCNVTGIETLPVYIIQTFEEMAADYELENFHDRIKIVDGDDEYKFFPDDYLLKVNNEEYFLDTDKIPTYYNCNHSKMVQAKYDINNYELKLSISEFGVDGQLIGVKYINDVKIDRYIITAFETILYRLSH